MLKKKVHTDSSVSSFIPSATLSPPCVHHCYTISLSTVSLQSLYSFSTVSIQFQQVVYIFYFAELPFELTASAVVKHPDGGALMVGGDNGNDTEVDSLLHLRHASAEWKVLKQKLKVPRRRHVAALVPDNLVKCT